LFLCLKLFLLYYFFQSYHSSSYSVFDLACWFVAFFSHMLWNVLVSLLLFNDGFVCCCLLSFIARLSVELVFLSVFFFLVDVYCFMLYYMLNKFSLVYLPVLISVCVVDFYILRGFSWRVSFSEKKLHGLVFVFRTSCKVVWTILACLLGEWRSHVSGAFLWTLLPRVVQDNTHILIVMCKTSKGIFITNSIFKKNDKINITKNSPVSVHRHLA